MKKLLSFLFAIALAFLFVLPVSAEGATERWYTSETTGNSAVIIDEADLLPDMEEDLLLSDMAPLTDYENVMFVTAALNKGEYASYADTVLRKTFPTKNASIFCGAKIGNRASKYPIALISPLCTGGIIRMPGVRCIMPSAM